MLLVIHDLMPMDKIRYLRFVPHQEPNTNHQEPYKELNTRNQKQYQELNNNKGCEKEISHIYFLKVHKAGSTSIQNLFMRFGHERDLNVLTLIQGFMSYPHKTFDSKLPPPPARLTEGKYDIYCEHNVFDEEYLLTKLHKDTVKIAILREPMSHLRSSFNFYVLEKKLNLGKFADPVAEFLEKPEYYSKNYNSRAKEVTHNRVAMEFGYNAQVHDLQEYLSYIRSKFLVLIMERLPESLVLMRRQLCWDMKSVLYGQARPKTYNKPQVNTTLVNMHKAWSPLDYEFYQYFSNVLENTIAEQDDCFHEEVALLEEYLAQTRDFCDNTCSQMGTLVKSHSSRESLESVLYNNTIFPASKWDSGFVLTGLDCLLMRVDPAVFRNIQKVRLFPEACLRNSSLIKELDLDPNYCGELISNTIPWSMLLQKVRFASPCWE